MKIPLLPYYIVSGRALKKGSDQKSMAVKQIAKLIRMNNRMIQFIRGLPEKYQKKLRDSIQDNKQVLQTGKKVG